MADVKFFREHCEMDKFEVDSPTNQSCIDFYKEEEPGREMLTLQGFGTKTLRRDSVKYYAHREKKKDDGTTLCLINCFVNDTSDLQIGVRILCSEYAHFENFCPSNLKRVLSTENSYS